MQRSTKISHKLIKKMSKTPLTNSFWNKNCPQQPAIFSSPRLKHLHFTSNRKSTNLTTPVARSFLPAVAQQNSFPAFERFIGFVNSFHPALKFTWEISETSENKKMAPFVKSLPTYIKDTNHALNILKQFSFPGNNKFLFTMDITSLYTVIPNNEGLLALKYFFDQRTVKEPPTDTLLRLAELVLTLNCFTFSGEIFKQINGVAMETKMGPNYANLILFRNCLNCVSTAKIFHNVIANLFVGYVEEQIFNQFDGPKPELFGRYIDDCLGATSCTKDELERFIGFVNSFHPALKFTREISETSVTFLNINISVQDNKLATSVHYKPTDSHSYLLYSSSHPSHVKDSIPYSQFLRLRRLCSEDSDFNSKCDEMSNFFSERGYPDSILSKALNRVQNVNRESALEPSASDNEERIPFTLTFHPNNLAARNVVLRKF